MLIYLLQSVAGSLNRNKSSQVRNKVDECNKKGPLCMGLTPLLRYDDGLKNKRYRLKCNNA
jgi:hypothetical protein